MALLKLVFLEGQRANYFFKAHQPSTEEPEALVGFKLRTEPELGTEDSQSTRMLLYFVWGVVCS